MKKILKNSKGFTLVELMMVIAVIGILAAVLIPKMSGVKDNARLGGVDANVRQVQAAAVATIERYQDVTSLTNFNTSLVSSCAEIVNPFDKNDIGGDVESDAKTLVDNKAVTIAKDTSDTPKTDVPDNAAANKGRIYVSYTKSTSSIDKIVITPYDNSGNAMAPTEVTP